MYQTILKDFDIRMLMGSGQVFRIAPCGEDCYTVTAGDHFVCLRCAGHQDAGCGKDEAFVEFSCTEEEFLSFWHNYFDLSLDYGAIKETVDPEDAFLQAAVAYGSGIRILRQDLWETIISFLISQNNNITRIRRSIEALCAKFGEKLDTDGHSMSFPEDRPFTGASFYSFPTPEAIIASGLDGLQDLGLGYRDKYILAMAKRCSGAPGQEFLASLEQADYDGAQAILMGEFGIGRKVADCICLYGLHHIGAFPVDTHVKQILASFYPDGFPFRRYEGFAGIIQQYMFYYKLSLSASGTVKKTGKQRTAKKKAG